MNIKENVLDIKTTWKNLSLSSACGYLTIAFMFLMLFITQAFQAGFWVSNLLTFFMLVLLRSLFETTVIQKISFQNLEFEKFLKFSALAALELTVINYLFKGYLGAWSPVVTILLSPSLIKRLKTKFFPQKKSSPLSKKLSIAQKTNLLFLALLGLPTYAICHFFGMDAFILAFGGSLFVALFTQLILDWIYVYEQKLKTSQVVWFFALSLLGTLFSIVLFMGSLSYGMSGKGATITSIIFLKLIQPWFVYRFVKI